MYDTRVGIKWDPTLTSIGRCYEIRKQAQQFPKIRNFIETGTADGATCDFLHNDFDYLATIEIVPTLHNQSKVRLEPFPNVELFLGDSEEVLPPLLQRLNDSCFFWLDGHFCGSLEARAPKDTPVAAELEIIFATRIPHIVFVDDARLFGRDPAYPTLDWVRNLATGQEIDYRFSLVDDIMRIVPNV